MTAMPSGFLSTVVAAGTAHAALPAQKVGQYAPATPGIFGALVALLLVIALILGLAWLLKRMPGSGFRQNDQLRLVASTAVGAKERLVVVEVAGQQLLLGVTAGGITRLHTLPEPLPDAAVPQMSQFGKVFAERLAQSLGKRPRKEP